jgi:peptidylprolyl isomerase
MSTRRLLACAAALAVLALAGCGDDGGKNESARTSPSKAQAQPAGTLGSKPRVVKPQGAAPAKLETRDLIPGKGKAAAKGDALTVQYVGVRFRDGKQFDASWDRDEPFRFQLGAGMVIPGWDRGLEGMKAGGRRELVVPPDLAYGPQGAPPDIGPNETLVFVIDLLKAR